MDDNKLSIFMKLLLICIITGSSFSVFGKDIEASANVPQKEIKKTTPQQTSNPYKRDNIHSHSIGIGVGQTFLNGHFGENGDDQVTADIYYDYTASHSFDFVANIHYSKQKYKDYYAQLPGLALSIKGKFFQFDAFAPFILGGLGFYMPKLKRSIAHEDQTIIRETESKVTFGLNIGLGGELKLNKHFKLWLLLHHHNPFDIKQNIGPEVEGRYTKLLMAGFYTF